MRWTKLAEFSSYKKINNQEISTARAHSQCWVLNYNGISDKYLRLNRQCCDRTLVIRIFLVFKGLAHLTLMEQSEPSTQASLLLVLCVTSCLWMYLRSIFLSLTAQPLWTLTDWKSLHPSAKHTNVAVILLMCCSCLNFCANSLSQSQIEGQLFWQFSHISIVHHTSHLNLEFYSIRFNPQIQPTIPRLCSLSLWPDCTMSSTSSYLSPDCVYVLKRNNSVVTETDSTHGIL